MISYDLPGPEIAQGILENHLATFDRSGIAWPEVIEASSGLSQAEIARAADEAAKVAVLDGSDDVPTPTLLAALQERHAAALSR